MGTAIIPPGNPTPILDPPEDDLDFVPLWGEGFVVAASCRSVLQGGDALIGTIATVGNQLFCLGKAGQDASGSRVIAGVPGSQQPVHRPARLVTHRVQLRIQATIRTANTAGDGPFGGRLAAVRWAFRWVDRSSDSLWSRVVAPTRGTPCDREQRDLDLVQLRRDQQTLLTHSHLQPE